MWMELKVVNLDEHLEFLKSRSSVRRFKSEPPPQELILRAKDTARCAPSAKNSQPWRFIVDDPDLKSKLANNHLWAKALYDAPSQS
jgi:nitroreductase